MKTAFTAPCAAMWIALLVWSTAIGVAASTPETANPFFAMDTALRDGKTRSAAEQATLLKSLGYDGIGASGHLSQDFIKAFESQGLRVFNTYLTLSFDSARPGLDPQLRQFVPRLKGHGTDLWVAVQAVTMHGVKLKASAEEGDAVVVEALRELADLAQASGVRVALYPHTWFWVERVEDALRVAKKVDRTNVGATFNLCHWLKVEGDRDPMPVLRTAAPKLFQVSISGADRGDTRTMNWDRLIQPLGQGDYEVGKLINGLREIGYRGPVGFQGFGIKGDSQDILGRTIEAWQAMSNPSPKKRGANPTPP